MQDECATRLLALLELPAAVGELSNRIASLEATIRRLCEMESEPFLDVASAAALLKMSPGAVSKRYTGVPSKRFVSGDD